MSLNVCVIIKQEDERERSYPPMIVMKVRILEVRLKVVTMNVLKKEVDQELHHEKILKVLLTQRYVLKFMLYNNLYLFKQI